MVKLKYNDEKNSFSLKNLNADHLVLLRAILDITRLGSEDTYKEAAFEILQAFDDQIGDHDWWDDCHVGFSSTPEEGFVLEVNDISDPDECEDCMGCCCN